MAERYSSEIESIESEGGEERPARPRRMASFGSALRIRTTRLRCWTGLQRNWTEAAKLADAPSQAWLGELMNSIVAEV